ncbi:MAG: hypothetical protein M1831_007237 [Alyxoria varia]|nr:MAG: hypothetical protein M1831_007237 [Alyxoria varia]
MLRSVNKVPASGGDFTSNLRGAIDGTEQDVRKLKGEWEIDDVKNILQFTRDAIQRGLPTQEEKNAWNVVTMIPTYTEDDERIVAGFWKRDHDDERFGLVLKDGDWGIPETTSEEEKGVFEKFQSECAGNDRLSFEWLTSGWMKVHISSGQYDLHFTIERVKDYGSWGYDVICSTKGDLGGTITGAMKKRPRQMDLRYTLEMITAFHDVDSATCVRCSEHKDGLGLPTAVRRRKKGKREWEALHGRCAL